MSYFHGGQAGLTVGAKLLPPGITGVRPAIDWVPNDEPLRQQGERVARRDRVYVTTDRATAETFAALHPSGTDRRGGDVYEVEPVGGLEPDEDCGEPGLSWQCPEAVVTRIVRTGVRRSPWVKALGGDAA